MLSEIGFESIDDLYSIVPEEVRLEKLNIPAGKSELEVRQEMKAISDKNKKNFKSTLFHFIFSSFKIQIFSLSKGIAHGGIAY